MLVHRLASIGFGNCTSPEDYLKSVKKFEGSCDEVWLSTLYGYPKLETHKHYAKSMESYAKLFREHGIKVSLQLGSTLGHGLPMAELDCSGLVYKGSNVRTMVGYDGRSSKYSFCYNDGVFIDYIKSSFNEYALLAPEIVYIDDDLRFMWHDSVDCGCFCDDCISRFNKKYNYDFDRKNLVAHITNNATIRNHYIEFMKDSLGNFVEEICDSFHKLSPNTNFGYQNCSINVPTGDSFIFDRMKKVTGKKPCFRPGGGSFSDAQPDVIIDKYVLRAMGIAQYAEEVSTIIPEIENIPFSSFGGKSHYGICLETSMYLAGGANAMSYSLMQSTTEPLEYYQETLKLFAEHRNYWETLIALNRDTHQTGIDYVIPKTSGSKQIEKNETVEKFFNDWFNPFLYTEGIGAFIKNGLPISFGNKQSKVKLLKYDCARCLSEPELKELLKMPCLCDVDAFKYLSKKYDCFNVTFEPISVEDGYKFQLKYAHDGIFYDLANKFIPKRYSFNNFTRIIPKNEDYVALSEFTTTSQEITPKPERYPYGIAECLVRTSQGAQWAVFGGDLWSPIMNYNRKIFFEKLYEYLSEEKINVRLLNINPAVVLPRANKENKITSVSILNCSLDEFSPEIIINNPIGQNFFVMDKHGVKLPINAMFDNGEYKLNLPKMQAYHMQTIIIEN